MEMEFIENTASGYLQRGFHHQTWNGNIFRFQPEECNLEHGLCYLNGGIQFTTGFMLSQGFPILVTI